LSYLWRVGRPVSQGLMLELKTVVNVVSGTLSCRVANQRRKGLQPS
jgi:hypothetical protein